MTDPRHPRRTDRTLADPADVRRIMHDGQYATFALCDGPEPYVVTLSYGWDQDADRLYFHVAHEGHKLDIVRANPRACGTIVLTEPYNQGECEHPYRSVVMRGTRARSGICSPGYRGMSLAMRSADRPRASRR